MPAPKELFYVEVHTAPGDGLRYAERGGGKFSRLIEAQARRENVLRKHPGAKIRILRTGTNWEEVTE